MIETGPSTIEGNPPDIKGQYLAGLNACFPNWGGDEMYRWCFERVFDGQAPDLLVVKDQGSRVAGSAVSYRRACTAEGARFRVGIMTGSWTLPEARQRGHFTQLIESSRALAAERGAALLLAFVTSTNASYRRLAAAGAAQWETYYLASSATRRGVNPAAAIQPVADWRRRVTEILERLAAPRVPLTGFLYDPDEWMAQFLERPTETEFLAVGTDGLAVIEKTVNTDRLLFFSGADETRFAMGLHALSARAATRGRTFMLFTTSPRWRTISMDAGLNCLPGYLMALSADEDARRTSMPGESWLGLQWELQSGDRM